MISNRAGDHEGHERPQDIVKMDCMAYMRSLPKSERAFVTFLQVYNILSGVLNICGNSILIWGLCRTRQTKTISFRFIAILSSSDLVTGVVGLVFVTLILFETFQERCWLRICVQVAIIIFNYFSAMVILLIALDRYLHMKYLEQYSFKFTKKRAYLLVTLAFALAVLISSLFALPVSPVNRGILQVACFCVGAIVVMLTLLLYRKALHRMKMNANHITRSIINHSKALGKAAKRISICYVLLTAPVILAYILDGINKQVSIINPSILDHGIWFGYITFLGNGFCSSVIFISQNIPIKRVLRRAVMEKWNRIRSEVGIMDKNV